MDDQQGYLGQSAIKGGEVRLSELQIQVEVLSQVQSDMKFVINDLQDENLRLRTRANNQRTELRRLNRRLSAMWEGVRFSHKVRTDMLLQQMAKGMARMEVTGRPAFDIGKINSFTIVESERPE